LFVRAEQQQRPDPDGVMRVNKNRCRRTTSSDFFQHLAVGHLREPVPPYSFGAVMPSTPMRPNPSITLAEYPPADRSPQDRDLHSKICEVQ
jgi:hypothetical protein